MNRAHTHSLRRRWRLIVRRRMANASDLGQTAIVAVVAFSVLAALIGAVLVQTVATSDPLLQTKAVQIYANRALEAGQNAYLTAVNANPSLAQCTTNTNGSGTCGGINYGEWNEVNGSTASGADQEYYAFGNPQPTFDPTTSALTNLSVQVVGAAYDPSATNNYLFDQETISITPSNGFLQNVWWSNYESYSANGDYSSCNYNWKLNYNIDNANVSCTPVYFGPNDYLFGPVYTNDSVFESPSPSFGTSSAPSTVTTADPNCLFVNDTYGMSGSSNNCSRANSDIANYDSVNSSYGHAIEQPPANDTQLGTIAQQNGCLYSGPTTIVLSKVGSVGEMTVTSPDTPEGTQSGDNNPWDSNNLSSNLNYCPNDGSTTTLPSNGVVFVENASAAQTQAWANPFDDPTYSTATTVTSSPAAPLQANRAQSVNLTATVISGSSTPSTGATVAFSQTTSTTTNGHTVTNTTVIPACSNVALSSPVAVTPATSPVTYKTTATCNTTEASNGTGAFSAVYSGGTNTATSSGNLGTTNTLSYSISYGPDAQVTAGGCNSCYYGQTSNPNAEGDAFVNGSLSGQLTIGTANNVIITGNLTYADCTWQLGQSGSSAASQGLCPYNLAAPNDSLGLIANQYVEVNRPLLTANTVEAPCGANLAATCDPSDGTNGITIDAAVLALTQSFVVNNYTIGSSEGPLYVYGSIQQYARGPVGTFSGNSVVSGYLKHYTWDPLLDFVSPPSYLAPSTPSWVLASATTNAGAGSASVCPSLNGIYAGITNGVIQDGQAITQYCSTGPGALPNYPSSTAPSPVTGVTATPHMNGTVTLSWTDPSSNGGPTISGYSVSSNPSCSSCTFSSLSGSSVTATTITGLTPGSAYNFAVTATNSSGTSSPSAASNTVTVPAVPSAPTLASATTNANGTVTVTWTDPQNNGWPITNYTIAPSPACSGCSYSSLSGPSVTSGTVTGLVKGGTYTFTVTATNAVGTGPASTVSNSVVAPNVPNAPTGVTAANGNDAATVSWTAPGSNGGSAITGYTVTSSTGGLTCTTTGTSCTVSGLTTGTPYTFTVKATNGVGIGAASSASNSVTAVTTPGAPTSVAATVVSTTSAAVAFSAPSSTGGSAVTGYTVTATDTTLSSRGGQTASGTASPITVTGLHAGDTYTFAVTPTNAVGTGTTSSNSNSLAMAAPGTPTIGTATAGSTGSKAATITFTAPSVAPPTITYTVTATDTTLASRGGQTQTGPGSSITVTGLTAGDVYKFTVKAANAAGTSATSGFSNTITAR